MSSFKSLFLVFVLAGLTLQVVSISTQPSMERMSTKMESIGKDWKAKTVRKNTCSLERHNDIWVKICPPTKAGV